VIYRLIRPLLFRLDPEDAHHRVMGGLAAFSRHPTACRLLDRALRVEDPALEVESFGLRFANPVGLAAGLDKHGEAVRALAALGFGAVEVGSITALAQPGNPRPRMFRLREHRALVNRMGFNSVGAEAAAKNLEASAPAALRTGRRFAVGVNLGRSKITPNERAAEDYCASVERLHRHADYFAVNVSSPNTPGLRDLQRREPLTALLRTVRERVVELGGERPPPVLVKLAPDLSGGELDDALAAAADAGVAGLIVSNTTLDRSAVAGHRHAAEAGGLSGGPLRAPSTAMIATVRARTRLPIIGVGGIDSAEAAYEKVRAGATLVQVYTGFIYEGPTLVRRINRGLLRLLRRDGFTCLAEAVG
jgi:dihydroorotate dehydrogenase